MRMTAVAILLSLYSVGSAFQAAPLNAYVRQVDYFVESYEGDRCMRDAHSLLMLYIGSPETEQIDNEASRGGITWNVSLVHPVAAQNGSPSAVPGTSATASSTTGARSRWYVTETNTARNLVRRGPLLNRAVWRSIPVVARRALLVLGPDDDELILISWNGISGSLSIWYSPRVQSDRRFHERKLEMLRDSMEAQEWQNDVPYERIDQSDLNGALVSRSPHGPSGRCDGRASSMGL